MLYICDRSIPVPNKDDVLSWTDYQGALLNGMYLYFTTNVTSLF